MAFGPPGGGFCATQHFPATSLLPNQLAMQTEYKGYNGIIVLGENTLTIKKGRWNFLLGDVTSRGEKTIPFSSISAVQYKKPGMTAGYIQFSFSGGSESKGGIMDAVKDENSVIFHNTGDNAQKFLELKHYVESRMGKSVSATPSVLDELEKLALLKDKGILTQEEFEAKKKQLLTAI
jgi:hypothetical protein